MAAPGSRTREGRGRDNADPDAPTGTSSDGGTYTSLSSSASHQRDGGDDATGRHGGSLHLAGASARRLFSRVTGDSAAPAATVAPPDPADPFVGATADTDSELEAGLRVGTDASDAASHDDDGDDDDKPHAEPVAALSPFQRAHAPALRGDDTDSGERLSQEALLHAEVAVGRPPGPIDAQAGSGLSGFSSLGDGDDAPLLSMSTGTADTGSNASESVAAHRGAAYFAAPGQLPERSPLLKHVLSNNAEAKAREDKVSTRRLTTNTARARANAMRKVGVAAVLAAEKAAAEGKPIPLIDTTVEEINEEAAALEAAATADESAVEVKPETDAAERPVSPPLSSPRSAAGDAPSGSPAIRSTDVAGAARGGGGAGDDAKSDSSGSDARTPFDSAVALGDTRPMKSPRSASFVPDPAQPSTPGTRSRVAADAVSSSASAQGASDSGAPRSQSHVAVDMIASGGTSTSPGARATPRKLAPLITPPMRRVTSYRRSPDRGRAFTPPTGSSPGAGSWYVAATASASWKALLHNRSPHHRDDSDASRSDAGSTSSKRSRAKLRPLPSSRKSQAASAALDEANTIAAAAAKHNPKRPAVINLSLASCSKAFRNGLRRAQRNKFQRVKLDRAEMNDEEACMYANALEPNTTLEMVDAPVNNIGDVGAIALADAVGSIAAPIRDVNLNDNQIGDEGAIAWAELLERNTVLTNLDLGKNKLNAEACRKLADVVIRRNKTLLTITVDHHTFHVHDLEGTNQNTSLSFSDCGLTRVDVIFLVYVLRASHELGRVNKLCTMDVSSNRLPAAEVKWILLTLGSLITGISSYDFTRNRLELQDARDLAGIITAMDHIDRAVVGEWPFRVKDLIGASNRTRLNFLFAEMVARKGERRRMNLLDLAFLTTCMASNSVATTLVIGNCERIGDEGARMLAEMLRVNTALRTLRLPNDAIGRPGALSIAAAVEFSTIAHVDLSRNAIYPEGAAALARALMTNVTLTGLELTDCEIGDRGITSICEMLHSNTTLAKLMVGRNRITDDGMHVLADTLVVNERLTYLDVSANSGLTMDGATEVASAMLFNTTLVSLIMNKCAVGNEGAESFALSLRRNKSLTELDLAATQMDWHGAKFLADSMRRNRTLGIMPLDGNPVPVEVLTALNNALSANRNFQGTYTRKGALIHGVRTFDNGDTLECGKNQRHGFYATGTYKMANDINDKDRKIVTIVTVISTLDTLFTVLAMLELLEAGGNDNVVALLLSFGIMASAGAAQLYSAVALFLEGRQLTAFFSLVSLSAVKEAVELIVFKRIDGVTVDVRSDAPVFGLAAMVKGLLRQGVVRGVPVALICFVAALSNRVPAAPLMWVTGMMALLAASTAVGMRDHRAMERIRGDITSEKAQRSSFRHLNVHHLSDEGSFIMFLLLSFWRFTELAVRTILPGLVLFGGTPSLMWFAWVFYVLASSWCYYGVPSKWGRYFCKQWAKFLEKRAAARRGQNVQNVKGGRRHRTLKARYKAVRRVVFSFCDATGTVAFALAMFHGFETITPKFWLHGGVHGKQTTFMLFRAVEEVGVLLLLQFLYVPQQVKRDITNYPPALVTIALYGVAVKNFMFLVMWLASSWAGMWWLPPEDDDSDDDYAAEQLAMPDPDTSVFAVPAPPPARVAAARIHEAQKARHAAGFFDDDDAAVFAAAEAAAAALKAKPKVQVAAPVASAAVETSHDADEGTEDDGGATGTMSVTTRGAAASVAASEAEFHASGHGFPGGAAPHDAGSVASGSRGSTVGGASERKASLQ